MVDVFVDAGSELSFVLIDVHIWRFSDSELLRLEDCSGWDRTLIKSAHLWLRGLFQILYLLLASTLLVEQVRVRFSNLGHLFIEGTFVSREVRFSTPVGSSNLDELVSLVWWCLYLHSSALVECLLYGFQASSIQLPACGVIWVWLAFFHSSLSVEARHHVWRFSFFRSSHMNVLQIWSLSILGLLLELSECKHVGVLFLLASWGAGASGWVDLTAPKWEQGIWNLEITWRRFCLHVFNRFLDLCQPLRSV